MTVGFYLWRMMDQSCRTVVEYDARPGGAGFIISDGGFSQPIVFEVGSQKSSNHQVYKNGHFKQEPLWLNCDGYQL